MSDISYLISEFRYVEKQPMQVRYLPNDAAYQRMTTRELRDAFVLENLFRPGLM